MNLLLKVNEDWGYPIDYLITRVKGKGAYLFSDWDYLLYNANLFEYLHESGRYRELVNEHSREAVWKSLLNEYKWIYFQMDCESRSIFEPFFAYNEISTIIHCFRHKLDRGTSGEIKALLSFSLLSDRIKSVMLMDSDLPQILEIFEKIVTGLSPSSKYSLKNVFSENGLTGVEQKLMSSFLNKMMSSRIHPIIWRFFKHVIDSKNLTAVYKHLRWSTAEEPSFIEGGSFPNSLVRKWLKDNEISKIRRYIFRFTGMSIENDSVPYIENMLRRGITKKIKIMKRDLSPVGFILEYLWRCYIEAINLSIIIYGENIDRNILKEEMII